MKPGKIRRRLEASLSEGRIATVVRDDFELEVTDGFVVALTDEWVVMHALDAGVYLDAMVMLRLRDVSRVWFRDDDAYHHRAIDGLGERVTSFEVDSSVRTAELIRMVSERAGIFLTYFEVLDGGPLCIGRLRASRNKSFDMDYVGRDGVWSKHLEKWKYRDVTRIECGGRYLSALNTFADPHPSAAEGQPDSS